MKIRTDFVTNSSSSSFILNYLNDGTVIDNEESIIMLHNIIKEITYSLRLMEDNIKLNDVLLYNYIQKFFKMSNIVFGKEVDNEHDNWLDMWHNLSCNKTFKQYIGNAANNISNKLNIKENLSKALFESYLNYSDITWLLYLENDYTLQKCRELYNFKNSIKNISSYEIDGIMSRFGNYGDISEYLTNDIIKKTQAYEYIEQEYDGANISTEDKILLTRNSGKITLPDIVLELLRTECDTDKLIEKLISEHYGHMILHGDNNEIPQIIKTILIEKLKYACEFY